MKTAIVALTKNGVLLASKMGGHFNADLYIKHDWVDKIVQNDHFLLIHPFTTEFKSLVEKLFEDYDAIIFIMACGIVVRSIAPFLKNKQSDPAVVVVDELGRFAISLLSGHIGGANRLASEAASLIGGIPVITTATDGQGVIAFDVFAEDNQCAIENLDTLKYISARLVNGGQVGFFTDMRMNGILPANILPYDAHQGVSHLVVLSNSARIPVGSEHTLILRPKNLVLGIGCRRGKTKEEIQKAVEVFLDSNHKSLLSISCIASIDLKANEKGLVDFCKGHKIPFRTYSAEALSGVGKNLQSSEFVKQTTGVGNVAEACALVAAEHSRLICPKTVIDGITLALAEEEKAVSL